MSEYILLEIIYRIIFIVGLLIGYYLGKRNDK